MSERPAVLAADLALCHPPLAVAEVRAVARPMDTASTFRVTVVAADRPGLLADTAAALADEDLTVVSASVATWTDPDIALHSLTVVSTSVGTPRWDDVGGRAASDGDGLPAAITLRADGPGDGDRGARAGRTGPSSGSAGPTRSGCSRRSVVGSPSTT